jgi:hypothetical protein
VRRPLGVKRIFQNETPSAATHFAENGSPDFNVYVQRVSFYRISSMKIYARAAAIFEKNGPSAISQYIIT